MNGRQRFLIRAIALWFILATSHNVAADLSRLINDDHLSVATSIKPEGNIVPGQKAQLVIEIATDTWFSGGTRITVPEVPGLVILQTEQFASNATEARQGKTWVIQRWTLDVFPQREGSWQIPALKLRLKVNAGSQGDIEGELFAPATPLESVRPQALENVERWVAAPAFSAEQRFDRELDALEVGDAFERRITFTATDSMAMMLPVAENPDIDGLAAYPLPPQLEDSNNRGEARAQRIETISYVAEQPGEYVLPAQEFFWWNTSSNSLEVVELPKQTIMVGGLAPTGNKEPPKEVSKRWLLDGLAGLLALLCVTVLLVKLLPKLPWTQSVKTLRALYKKLLELRRPALPERLNP